jgi:hypothetical protein
MPLTASYAFFLAKAGFFYRKSRCNIAPYKYDFSYLCSGSYCNVDSSFVPPHFCTLRLQVKLACVNRFRYNHRSYHGSSRSWLLVILDRHLILRRTTRPSAKAQPTCWHITSARHHYSSLLLWSYIPTLRINKTQRLRLLI